MGWGLRVGGAKIPSSPNTKRALPTRLASELNSLALPDPFQPVDVKRGGCLLLYMPLLPPLLLLPQLLLLLLLLLLPLSPKVRAWQYSGGFIRNSYSVFFLWCLCPGEQRQVNQTRRQLPATSPHTTRTAARGAARGEARGGVGKVSVGCARARRRNRPKLHLAPTGS